MAPRTLTALVLLGPASTSLAQESPHEAAVTWTQAPEAFGCPSAEASEAAIAEALGRPLVTSSQAVTARITLSSDGTMDAHIELVGADGMVLGTRTIDTPDATCITLTEGLPLVVAMLVDLHREDAVLHLRHPEASSDPFEATLATGLSFDLGWLPEPTWLPFVEVLLGQGPIVRGWMRVAFSAPQRSVRVFETLSPEANVWGVVGVLGACVLPEVGALTLGGCLGLEGGWLEVVGSGLSSPQTNDAAHLAADVLARGSVSIGPATLGLEAGIAAGLLRQRLVYTDGMELEFFESAPVSFRTSLFFGIHVDS